MTAPAGKADKGAAKQQRGGSLDRITAKGVIAIDKVLYQQTALTNLKATLDLANGVLKLDPVTAGIFGGQEAGAITADLREASPPFTIKVKLTNVDSNQLLSATSSVKNIVSGPLSGNFDLRFISKENQNIATTLNGVAQMQMGPGRIAGVQILNEMASIGRFMGYTNKQEAYTNINKVSGSLNIQNGVATTNDLLVDLGGGTLAGAGTMGLVDQTLKLKVTSHADERICAEERVRAGGRTALDGTFQSEGRPGGARYRERHLRPAQIRARRRTDGEAEAERPLRRWWQRR